MVDLPARVVLTERESETSTPRKSTHGRPRACHTGVGDVTMEGARTGWTLTSTNGYTRLRCEPEYGLRGGVWLAHDLRVSYELPSDDLITLSLERDCLSLDSGRMGELLSALRRWLEQPLDALKAAPFEHSVDLGRAPHQSLRLDFGPHHDVILGPGATGCLLELRAEFSAQLVFATDPTSLDTLADGLALVLLERRR